MTLAEFLLARIAEDERVAAGLQYDMLVAQLSSPPLVMYLLGPFFARFDPARVLAECEAKRRIVERAGAFREPSDESAVWDRWDQGWAAAMEGALKILALPYADHPDYDESWRL